MSYFKCALPICALLLVGCAAKNRANSIPGTIHHYEHCHEVSIDAKAETVTVVCPLKQK